MPIKYTLIVCLFCIVDVNKFDQTKIVCNYSIRNRECSFFLEKRIFFIPIYVQVCAFNQTELKVSENKK